MKHDPAFPHKATEPVIGSSEKDYPGVTKLELAAMIAMQGVCANPMYLEKDYSYMTDVALNAAHALLDRMEK